ncbi:MAG: cupin domain-containing protein [Bacteroidia bacterium]|nr:cupin domain-containing protein [Bacteroidia bacterium]
MRISPEQALNRLNTAGGVFLEVFQHGTLSVELYKPRAKDLQQPHTRDEVYVVIAGQGMFVMDEVQYAYRAGDMIFVPAGAVHRFETFSPDFMTWVFFYGPEGGEKH